jgi:hypothetical protein
MALDFSTLTEASFRGTGFPVISITEIGSQNMPQHKKADRDGARVEGTGLNPFQYAVKIPFLSTISPGPESLWVNLFPEIYFEMKEHFKNRATGYFIHPLYGGIKVKPVSWQADMNADTRSGIIVDIVFVETTEDENSIVNTSYQASAQTSAESLDAQLGNIMLPKTDVLEDPNFSPPILPKITTDNTQTFGEFVNSLTAVVDKGTLVKNQFISKIDSAMDSINKLSISAQAVVQEKDPITQTVIQTKKIGNGIVNVTNTATQLFLALHDYKKQIIAEDKETSIYITPKQTTLPGICKVTQNSVKELGELNNFKRGVLIAQYTPVRYYVK